MNQPQPSSDDLRPWAGSNAASAPARSGFTLRGRTWAYAATLAAAGVLGGTGTAYAVVPPPTTQTVQVPTQTDRQDVV